MKAQSKVRPNPREKYLTEFKKLIERRIRLVLKDALVSVKGLDGNRLLVEVEDDEFRFSDIGYVVEACREYGRIVEARIRGEVWDLELEAYTDEYGNPVADGNAWAEVVVSVILEPYDYRPTRMELEEAVFSSI